MPTPQESAFDALAIGLASSKPRTVLDLAGREWGAIVERALLGIEPAANDLHDLNDLRTKKEKLGHVPRPRT